MILRINTDYFIIQNQTTGLCDEEQCVFCMAETELLNRELIQLTCNLITTTKSPEA
jgi:hypothetical protein